MKGSKLNLSGITTKHPSHLDPKF